ncbi:collagen-binding protein [Porphyromonas sp. COT-290 OH860]|nr:collagen-binding protein [Porphyromonas sp. COT-290 OH860]
MAKNLYCLGMALLLTTPWAQARVTIPASEHITLMQQAESVCQGVVKDAKGEPLIGVTVLVKGTNIGAVTDLDGQFSIPKVQLGSQLEFSSIGYVTQQAIYRGQPLQIVLLEDNTQLEELVVVGYGVQKKVNLTGAVSSVKGGELARRPVTNATQSLQGLVPGLLVSNNQSGRPGASASLSLRGQGNLSGSASPYVLVDGVEMSLAEVNPNDIENISVLKDAAASAIYGARAAYGVILVTTKRGDVGKMRISYQGNVGWSTPTVLPKMVNSVDFAHFWNDGATNAGAPRKYSPERIALLEKYINDPSSVDPWADLPKNHSMNPAYENTEKGIGNVDYFKLHYKDLALKHNHTLSLSGGSKAAQYYVSGGYYNEQGILRYADMAFSRYNFSASLTSQLTKWLKLKTSTKFMHTDDRSPFGPGGLSNGFFHSLARFFPTISEIDPNGRFTELSMVPYLQSGTYTHGKDNNLNLSAGIELQPLRNWFIFLDYTHRLSLHEYEALNKAPLIYGADGKSVSLGVRSELGIARDGRFTRQFDRHKYSSFNLYSNYLFSLGEKHDFTVMGGFQQESSHSSYLGSSITGLFSQTNPNVGMGTGDKVPTDVRNGWATRGFFGRLNYSYDGRYLLELNGRYDGSSRFAEHSRWGFFPSASLGWNIHREQFMESLSGTLSNFKLRGSYGLLGNQAGAALYTFASTMELSRGLGQYIFPDGRHSYTNAPRVISPTTTWEKVESINVGLDFGLWGNSLTGSIDLFQRDTRDMLGPGLPFPDYFGADAPQTNNASLRNRGWELSLGYQGRIGKDITYKVTGILSDATSIVTKYENPTKSDPQGSWYEGRSVGEIWGYRADGLIQTAEEAKAYNDQHDLSFLSKRPWTPGDVKYRDLNGDGRINNGKNKVGDMGDLDIIGDTTPRYQYSVNGSISYKGLSLSFMLQGVGKRDWNPGGAAYFWGSGAYAQVTVFKEHLDYWREDNPGAYYPKPYIHGVGAIGSFQSKTRQTSDRYLQNAAYCRLKNLTLSYDIPQMWVNKLGINGLQVFFSGENLLTFTSLKTMFDPEVIFATSGYSADKNYPMNRVLSCGLTVNL